MPASARQSQNVPVSYPRDADLAIWQTTKMPICRAFSKPSDGLEPSTPSLPWRIRAALDSRRNRALPHQAFPVASLSSSARRTLPRALSLPGWTSNPSPEVIPK